MSDDPDLPPVTSLSVVTVQTRLQQRLGDQTDYILVEPYQSGSLVGVAIVTNTETPGRDYAVDGSLQDAIDDPLKFADDTADKLLNMIRADS